MEKHKKLQELFFNYPTKQWHFEELLRTVGLSRGQTNFWLKRWKEDGLILRVKPRGKMPFYHAHHEGPHYQNSKRLFALEQLHQCGLLDYLVSLKNVDTIILFGSFARWDWHKESDIDLFVYGDVEQLSLAKFYPQLHREIQVFSGKNEEDLKRFGSGLLRNILKGIPIKGEMPREMIRDAAV